LPLSRPTEFLLLGRRQNIWTISELFNPDESKRAKKMLELALSQVFSGLDENLTDLAPTLDKTHKKTRVQPVGGT
jgi:hypothetical protein